MEAETVLDTINERLVQTKEKASRGLTREVQEDLDSYYEEAYKAYRSSVLFYNEMQKTLKKYPSPVIAAKTSLILDNTLTPLERWMKKYAHGRKEYVRLVKTARYNSSPQEKESEFGRYIGDLTHAIDFASKIGDIKLAESAFDFRQSRLEGKITELSQRIKNLNADIRGTSTPEVREELEVQLNFLSLTQQAYKLGLNQFKSQYAHLLERTARANKS